MADIIAAGIIPVAIEFMDKPAIEICEAFAHAGYPLNVEAMLIIADTESTLILTGNGDVLEPEQGIAAIGSETSSLARNPEPYSNSSISSRRTASGSSAAA